MYGTCASSDMPRPRKGKCRWKTLAVFFVPEVPAFEAGDCPELRLGIRPRVTRTRHVSMGWVTRVARVAARTGVLKEQSVLVVVVDDEVGWSAISHVCSRERWAEIWMPEKTKARTAARDPPR